MTMDFKVSQKNNGEGLIINEYTGQDTFCEVPAYIDNRCVCGIAKFAFSEHRELEKVKLPETITVIDAHAFYNCRAIREIELTDSIVELGDGVFKNCRNVRRISLYKKSNNTKTLKGLLEEFNSETEVEIYYEDGMAKLIFPYYLHNYEEDTPARIINEVTAGAGVHYRECIGSDDVHYAEYDSLFLSGLHIDILDSSWKIALSRIAYPYKLSDLAEKKYRMFLTENKNVLVSQLVAQEQTEYLRQLLELDLLDREDLRKCIEEAREASHMEGLGILLAYQKEKYGTVRKKFEL